VVDEAKAGQVPAEPEGQALHTLAGAV